MGSRHPLAPNRAVAAGLALATALSLLLPTGALDAGYWIDEAIAVGIASRELADIPRSLRLDGSPPLYYLLLHGWMDLGGAGEAWTRALSLAFAGSAVPASWWAGSRAFDRRAGALAAAGAAGCPFLAHYGHETRMYSLVVLLSVLAAGSFVLAFVRGRRRHVPLLGLWLALLLYTHTWGVFLAAGFAVAWLVRWRAGHVGGRDGAWLGAAVAMAYAPWIPSLAFQAAHTGAPWAERPGLLHLLGVPGGLFGYVAAPLLALAVAGGLRRARAGAAVRSLALVAGTAVALAWLASQVEPAWSPRYLAVLFGPLLLAAAAAASRGRGGTVAALVAVAAIWAVSAPPAVKSNVRAVAGAVAPALRPGDLVISTQPEQVPVLHRYLPRGVGYLTPLGWVSDPRMTDWRDGVTRLRAGRAETTLEPFLARLAPGRRVLLVTPVTHRRVNRSPWARAVRARTREWGAALAAHPRLRPIGAAGASTPRELRSAVRARLYAVRPLHR